MRSDENRRSTILWGALVIGGVCLLFCGFLLLRTRLGEGVLADWVTMIGGILTTPFLMEGFFIVTGFMLVVWINHLRRQREGDEFVDLAEFETREDPGGKGKTIH